MHGLTRIFLTLLVASQALAHGDQKEATPNDEHNARYYRTMLEQWEGIKAKPIRAFKKELVSLLESAAEHLLRTEQHPNQRAGCLRLAVIVDTLSVEDEADFFLKLHIFAKNETVLVGVRDRNIPSLINAIAEYCEEMVKRIAPGNLRSSSQVETYHGEVMQRWIAQQALLLSREKLITKHHLLLFRNLQRLERDMSHIQGAKSAVHTGNTQPGPLPFVATGASTYLFGSFAEEMFVPAVHSRFLETAAAGTAFHYIVSMAKPIAIVSILTFLGYKGYKWFNGDSSAEAIRNETRLKINQLEKDLLKANAKTYETTMKNLDAAQKKNEARYRQLALEQAKAIASLASSEAKVRELSEGLERRINVTSDKFKDLLKDWSEYFEKAETMSETERIAHLRNMRKKAEEQRADLEKASRPFKRRGSLARLFGCFGVPSTPRNADQPST